MNIISATERFLNFFGASPCSYQRTNESLDSKIEGLDVNEEDTILAVGGSGDQAFAMLEKEAKVTAVDKSRWQISLIKRRIELLRKQNVDQFLDSSPKWLRRTDLYDYFLKEGAIEKIRQNLKNLRVIRGDITTVIKEFPVGTFNKIYLSNVVEPSELLPKETPHQSSYPMSQMVPYLRIGGLMYHCLSVFSSYSLPGLELDEDLTQKARAHLGWKPVVLRKTA